MTWSRHTDRNTHTSKHIYREFFDNMYNWVAWVATDAWVAINCIYITYVLYTLSFSLTHKRRSGPCWGASSQLVSSHCYDVLVRQKVQINSTYLHPRGFLNTGGIENHVRVLEGKGDRFSIFLRLIKTPFYKRCTYSKTDTWLSVFFFTVKAFSY